MIFLAFVPYTVLFSADFPHSSMKYYRYSNLTEEAAEVWRGKIN